MVDAIKEANVITYLRQKTPDGYENPTYVSVEQRFVGPMRGTSLIHNLEEQYLLGTDTYAVDTTDEEGNTIITKSFTPENPNVSEGFYQIITTKYKDPQRYGPQGGTTYHFEGNKLVIPNDQTTSFVGNAMQCADSTIYGFEDDNTLKIYPNYFTKTQRDDLYYVKSQNIVDPSDDDRAYVLTKETVNMVNTKKETITREVIFKDENILGGNNNG